MAQQLAIETRGLTKQFDRIIQELGGIFRADLIYNNSQSFMKICRGKLFRI